MTVLEMLKTLLNIELTDTSKDAVLNFYLRSAKVEIAEYKRVVYVDSDVDFEIKYFDAICKQAKFEYSNKNQVGVKQYSESKRSVTYKEDSGLIAEVKAMIGYPSIVMF